MFCYVLEHDRINLNHRGRHCEFRTGRRPTSVDETGRAVRQYSGAVGIEVGFCLVRGSPVASWTRSGSMTSTGATGRYAPGARLLGFFR
jgi:hypothetical protein